MSKTFFLLLSIAALSVSSSSRRYSRTVRYDDEVLVKCPTGAPGVKEFIQRDDIDLWTVRVDGTADVRVKEALFAASDVRPVCSIVGNVEQLVQRVENATFPPKKDGLKAEWFEEYHRYEEIVGWYRGLAENNPHLVQYTDSIGKSYEGREQPAIYIRERAAEKQIYFQCQIHAREWISGATCMYIANQLVEDYNNGDERVVNLLKELEFIFVPFVNPDGYEYTWTTNRLWRKNRRPGSPCDGVDLNRNYNDHWNEGGSSSNPCSETYHGTGPASEPETQNTANFFKERDAIVGAIDWHSYSQLILRPYGWTSANSPDEAQLKALGDDMSSIILGVHGQRYTSQKSIGLYATSGTASDWFYGDDANENNAYRAAGYTIELRDTGRFGFELPPSEIIPQGEEIFPAVIKFAESLKDNPLKN